MSEIENEFKETAREFSQGAQDALGQDNKKIVAGILALLIGSLGIHKFILGYTKEGIIQIVISIVTCGIAGIIPFIEGIIYLTKSDADFYNTYQVGRRPWF
ncbi:TM2 domain-containing membrane protein YozV [Flavobacterium gossypii]|jgi:Predicted membrane protein|uniref:TM2 domain-containing membrane protein YozV n=2 Tax=Flavobacterium TaxID=237 RepID=A0A495MM89_9FLAO|nr:MULTISPECIES: TM2 domain-containing protein [Flavobacterium]MBA9073526.1 TM2 domain-containing membrane protein YozV [Flavobacterium gossypii]RKS26548.1 TM2 domain-containing membrane protein YozV [Flavobacterium endophyticum]WDO13971.1 TM2 domain-containing protein [Flavobacterium sp. WW92]